MSEQTRPVPVIGSLNMDLVMQPEHLLARPDHHGQWLLHRVRWQGRQPGGRRRAARCEGQHGRLRRARCVCRDTSRWPASRWYPASTTCCRWTARSAPRSSPGMQPAPTRPWWRPARTSAADPALVDRALADAPAAQDPRATWKSRRRRTLVRCRPRTMPGAPPPPTRRRRGAIPADLLPPVDLVTPNETEVAAAIAGRPVANRADALAAARTLLKLGARAGLVTLGGDGAIWCDRQRALHCPAVTVRGAVDTTAAGDVMSGRWQWRWQSVSRWSKAWPAAAAAMRRRKSQPGRVMHRHRCMTCRTWPAKPGLARFA